MARSSAMFDEGELVILGLIGLGVWIFAKGGVTNAAAAAGAAAVQAVTDAAGGAVTGVVTGISQQVGLPTPAQAGQNDDPYIARWIIDQPSGGKFEASKWSTSSAFLNALTIDAGQGVAPPHDSPLWAMFGTTVDVPASGTSGAIDFGTGPGW